MLYIADFCLLAPLCCSLVVHIVRKKKDSSLKVTCFGAAVQRQDKVKPVVQLKTSFGLQCVSMLNPYSALIPKCQNPCVPLKLKMFIPLEQCDESRSPFDEKLGGG